MAEPTIDSHAHVFHRGLTLAAERRYTPGYDASLRDYLEQLNCNCLSYGVLVQPSFLGTDNSHLLDCLRRAPQRLRGVAVIDPAGRQAEPVQAGRGRGRRNPVEPGRPAHSRPRRQRLGPACSKRCNAWDGMWRCSATRLASRPSFRDCSTSAVQVVVDHFGLPDPGGRRR